MPTVFSKNRQRLIEHGTVVAFFDQMLAQAERQNWLSKEHCSVDGTLIQAWASHIVPKGDGSDDAVGDGIDTHASKTDPDSRPYREGTTASELRIMRHTLIENRNGLIVDAAVTQADGYVERGRPKPGSARLRQANPEAAITLGADKGYDAKEEFVAEFCGLTVQPHGAQNTSERHSAVPGEIAQSDGYAVSMQCRRRIEQSFGWAQTVGRVRHVMLRGLKKVGQMFVLNMPAHIPRAHAHAGASASAGAGLGQKARPKR